IDGCESELRGWRRGGEKPASCATRLPHAPPGSNQWHPSSRLSGGPAKQRATSWSRGGLAVRQAGIALETAWGAPHPRSRTKIVEWISILTAPFPSFFQSGGLSRCNLLSKIDNVGQGCYSLTIAS